ncbi:hypothetical protein K493DRAFT_340012 [Basidiobolus meristosporus CBS 931.73]|uniref:Uncharacterized protein n=1 Tax=Basidiobolus meristosporus CBS 931.73 TaxID=1314790 RepID=A0A1Y1XXI7_9FUNG|nr:hypothetical protein K493DRAFT_340012 [Basidiobolus meristosporus CBS 931.73]|eukprot:ORX90451.1 hypothetical protein K493DRAFT_340012 [Basidiobolus meristosporus CBS 931.73]
MKRNPGIARITGNTMRSSVLRNNPLDSPLFDSPSVDFASMSLLHESRHRKGPSLPGAEDLDSTIDESRFQMKPTYRLGNLTPFLDESLSPETRRFTMDSPIGYSPTRDKHLESLRSPSITPLSARSNGSRQRTRPKSMIVAGSSYANELMNSDDEPRLRSISATGGPATPTNISQHTDALCSTPVGSLSTPRGIGNSIPGNLKSPYSPTKMFNEVPDSSGKLSTTRSISGGFLNPHGRNTSEISSRLNGYLSHRESGEATSHFTDKQVQVVQQVVQECLREYITEAQVSIREELKTMQLEMEEMREDWLQIQVGQHQKMEEELKRLHAHWPKLRFNERPPG